MGSVAKDQGDNRDKVTGTDVVETQSKKIEIAPAIENPFVAETFKDQRSQKKHSTVLFLQPFKARPRIITDFEHVSDLGSGTFSTAVVAAWTGCYML